MPPYNSPVRLEKLSLQRIGKYVSDLGVQLVTSAHASTAPDFTSVSSTSLFPARQIRKHLKDMLHSMASYRLSSISSKSFLLVQKVCQHLHEVLCCMVPYYMVNSVTTELLKQLDNRLDDIQELTEQPWCKKVLHEIVKAVLHPELTELSVTWRWRHITEFVVIEMSNLCNLKVFKLPINVEFIEKARTSSMELAVTKQLHSMTNLQKFIFHHYCTDDTMRVLCESCPQLKCLDIYLSNNVTDASVKHILKLKHLEELDVTETDISDDGRVHLLTGLAQNGAQLLKCYRSYCVTNQELCSLADQFPDLKEFSASLVPEDLSVREFRKFYNLEVCNLYSYGEFLYNDMFKFIGNHLLKLSFVGPSVNMVAIIKNCPMLTSLTIKVDHLRMGHEPLPGLSSLQHLTLRTRDSPGATVLLSQCQNLTSLQLCAQQMFFFTFLDDVLMKNKLTCLQHLCIGSLNGNLPPEAVTFITQHCSNLSTCKVFGGQDAELRAQYHQYPGVQVEPDLWIQLADNVGFANKGRKTEIVKTIVNYMYEFRSPYSFD
ncbi:uncharacterized protein [Periplaneta americana]|uniref:uncharacterized protein n=1 Tax=Periplaneta americana TaxID=6978 RepID=UPI0037E85FA6